MNREGVSTRYGSLIANTAMATATTTSGGTSGSGKKNTTDYNVIRHQDWAPEAEAFEFNDNVLKTQAGGLAVGFRCSGKKLRIKSPKMRCPFGLQQGMEGKGFNLQMAFDDSEACQSFLKCCQTFDQIIRQAGVDHAETWFAKTKSGKAPSSAFIEEKFYPMLKEPSDPKYHCTFKIKLPTKKTNDVEVFQCRLYNKDKQQIDIDTSSLHGGCHVTVMMTCSSIWSTSTGFGATWKAEQIMVFPSDRAQVPDYCLLNVNSDSEDDSPKEAVLGDEDSETGAATTTATATATSTATAGAPAALSRAATTTASAPATSTATATTAAADEEDEEGEDPEDETPEPVPEPVPEVKKPVARGKKAPVAAKK